LPQAKKKPKTAIAEGNPIAHRLGETFLIMTVLVSVYLIACLASYAPTDPGPFNSVASQQVSNVGRVLGAWLANFFLFLTGYLAYSLPLLLVYTGWLVYARAGNGSLGSPGCCCSFFPPRASRTCTRCRRPVPCPPAGAA
jgi:hypothetical protein